MNRLQHTVIRGLSLTVVCAAMVLVTFSCSRDEDTTPGGGRRALAVDVQMQSSDWTTRAGAVGGAATDGGPSRAQVVGSVDLDERLELVTECEPMDYTQDSQGTPGIQATQDAPDTPGTLLTRGAPAGSAAELRSMGISVYTNSTFTKTLTATNNGGSWEIANNILLNLDKDTYSYYAYAPVGPADNGIVLQAGGKTLTYTAPAEITKHPDLCRATPILGDNTGTVTFAMQHALTAVGVKVRADSVEIQSIKLLGVQPSGTLDLTTGAWTGLGGGEGTELAFTLSNTKPETGNEAKSIIHGDGYLMLPPQSLATDGKKLVIVYRYAGESVWRTGTHPLSAITSGGAWSAGQRVNYVIQLKAKFALDLMASATVSYSAGSYTLSYTTGSLSSSDPKVIYPSSDTWITDLTVTRGSGKGTITFDYTQNTSTTASRRTTMKVTSGFTTRDFVFRQLIESWIRLSAEAPGETVPGTGKSYPITVEANTAWTASATNVTLSPTSGGIGTTAVTITVAKTTLATARAVSVKFTTNAAGASATQTWAGTQARADPENATYVDGIWWSKKDAGETTWHNAPNLCKSPWRLPTEADFTSLANAGYTIMHNLDIVGYVSDGYHAFWGGEDYNRLGATLDNGKVSVAHKDNPCRVRCCQ